MKTKLFFWILSLWFILSSPLKAQRIYLSGEDAAHAVPWDFKISTGKNSGEWTTIPVPSNWELHGFGYYTYGEDHENYETDPEIGYYKRQFNLSDIEGKRFRLTFQGAMTDTHVKINGKSAGEVHQGGFMPFSYEITHLVKEGENLIEAEVRKPSENANIQKAERETDFWLFGGIFRPVYIDVLSEEFIERVAIDAQMDGSFKMDVYLDNIRKTDRLSARVFDDNGNQVGQPVSQKVAERDSVMRLENHFKNIKQWSHEYPNLYKVEVTLQGGGDLIHRYSQKFGFRTFEVRDHDGFYLNGERILLKGANMHSFRPETGRALSKKDMEENLRLLKGMNSNAVRPPHYPPDEYFFTLCDSLGLLTMNESTGWTHPLNKSEGSRLIKEMIARDVNHPSIVLWGNGNHNAHNPGLDEDFFTWDIQDRRPLKNAAKSEEWPGGYNPDFDIVDTRFYPSYQQLKERLADTHIVLPNEALHALYDGAGAAGLADYWDAIKASKVGGGLMIWALFDEGIVRTDQANRIDVQGNKAPDGLISPHGEKEGSYYAAKEIWSPVQIAMSDLPQDFNGIIPLVNEFSFVNLNSCRFEWKLINFAAKNEALGGFRTVAEGVSIAEDIPPGRKGNLNIKLPGHWRSSDALLLNIIDHQGNEILTKTFPIASRKQLAGKFMTESGQKIKRDRNNPFRFHAGNTSFEFDRNSGVLTEVRVNDKRLSVDNFPFLVAKPAEDSLILKREKGRVEVKEQDGKYRIESVKNNSFDRFSWTLFPDGTLELDYAYSLPQGNYYYAGIGMEVPAEKITGKRWLGKGPYRIWKNRTQGGILNVWDVKKKANVPGEQWNYPEFEGFFAPWYWAVIRFEDLRNIGISVPDDDRPILGVLSPRNGADPEYATWQYPDKDAIYLFNAISPVGGKWKKAEDYGPSSQPAEMGGTIKGSVQFNFGWNQKESEHTIYKTEIE